MKKKRIELLFVCAITLSTLSGCIKRSDRISLSDWLSSMTGSSDGSSDSSSDSSSGGEVVDENLEISFNDNMKTILEKYKEPDDEVGNVWVYYRYSTASFYNDWKKMNELLQSTKTSDITKGEALYEKLKGTECVLLYFEFDNTTKNVKKCFKDYHWAYSLSDFSIHDQNKEIKKVDFFDKPVINYYMDRSDYPDTYKALDNSIKISYLTTFEDKSYILYSTNAEVDFNDSQSYLNWKDEFTSYKQSVQNKKIGEINNDNYIVEWDANYEFPYGEYELGSEILTDKTFWKEAGDYSYISFSHSVDGKNVNERYLVHVENKKEITIDRSVTYMVPGAFNSADKVKSVIIQGPSTSYGSNQKYLTIPSNAFQGANKVSKVYLTGELVIEDYAFNGAPNAELYFSYGTSYKGNIETFEKNYAKNTDGTKHIEHWGATMDQFYNVSLPEDYNYYYGDKLLYSASSYSEPSLSKIIDKLVYPSSSSEKWVANSIQLENEDEEEGIHNYRVSSWHNGTLGLYINHYDEDDVISSYSGAETKVTLPTRLLIDEDQIMDLLSLKIGDSAFSDSKIETITNLDRVTSIGSKAFASCTSLKNISIPKTVEFIGLGAFNGCSNLEFIELPFIGQSEEKNYNLAYIFALNMNNDNYKYVPSALKTVQILEGLDSIPDDAFSNCSNITSITIPNSVHSIGNRAFKGCTSLKSIEFSNQLTTIGDAAFEQCTSLTDLVIPQSVNKIGKSAFAGCSQLTLYCEKEKQPSEWDIQWNYSNCLVIWGYGGEYGTFDALKYAVCIKDGTKYVTITDCDKSVTEIKIPEKINGMMVYSISDYTFFECKSLSKIVLPNTIQSIGEAAFYNCISLTNITIPGSVTRMGSRAFSGCTSLTSIEIPSSVTSIGDYAFEGCTTLNSITIPGSVTNIGESAFKGCTSLANVYFEGTIEDWSRIQFNNCFSTPMYYGACFYLLDQNNLYQEVTKIEIPNTITTIGAYQFYGFNKVIEIIIPNSVINIGSYAFSDCKSLTNIWVSSNVINIGERAFENCSSLTNIEIPKGVTSIENYTFSGCKSLKEIIIPNSVTIIDDFAFSSCTSLVSVKIQNGVLSIGDYAFYACSSLTSIEIPSSVTSIGKNVLRECYSLQSITLPFIGKSVDNPSTLGYFFGDTFQGGKYYIYVPQTLKEVKILDGCINIGDSAFKNCTSLTSIEIPSSVTSIGKYAFYGCKYLESIVSKGNVKTIGQSAFGECPLLIIYCEAKWQPSCWNGGTGGIGIVWNYAGHHGKYDGLSYAVCSEDGSQYIVILKYNQSKAELKIPESIYGIPVTTIYGSAFYNCTSLTSIEIPSSVTSIEYGAFKNCTSLVSVKIQNGVLSIGDYAFKGCTSLTSIEIPNSITSIGYQAFGGCSSLEKIVLPFIPDGYLGYVFGASSYTDNKKYVPTALKEIIILDSCTNIEKYAFYGCTSLVSATIPNGALSIGDYAFEGCTTLTSITIPGSVTSIGKSAFKGCISLVSVTIQKGVLCIGDHAFENCTSLVSIKIPYSATSIGESAFSNCTSLVDISILNSSISSIGKSAFSGCTKLIRIVIPNSVITIGESAFFNCTSLTDITISGSITSIGKNAFNNCKSLMNVYYEGTIENWCNIRFANIYSTPMFYAKRFYKMIRSDYGNIITKIEIPSSITTIGDFQFYNFKSVKEITISGSVTSIGEYAFYGCLSLTSIEIPSSVTSIGSYAFYGCTSLVSAKIRNGVLSIGDFAFYKCSSLTSIEIPSSVTSIKGRAFYGCTSLTSIEIPSSVTSIGEYAFSGCESLTSVYYEGTIEDWCNIQFGGYDSTPMFYASHFYMLDQNNLYQEVTKVEIPNTVTTIGDYQFYGFNNVTKIIIPSSVTSIGWRAFKECTSLRSIVIQNGVLSIGASAFEDCTSLASIEIPSSVTSLGGSAFSGCTSLVSAKIRNGVLSIGNYAFYKCSSLTSIEIPSSVTSLGASAFRECTSLTSIEIPSSVTSIGDRAFDGCTSLVSVKIQNGVLSIGDYAFYKCSSLTSIEIPSSVTSIGENVLLFCSSLKKITLPFIPNGYLNYIFGGLNYSYSSFVPTTLKEVIILDSCTKIEEYAFYKCSSLTSVVIPSSVTSIGSYAFYGCTSLTIYCEAENKPSGWSANWYENRCPVVWNYAGKHGIYNGFSYAICSKDGNQYIIIVGYDQSETEIEIPESINGIAVTAISAWAFKGCSSLTSIILPSSVTSIGYGAFSGCSSLTKIVLPFIPDGYLGYVFGASSYTDNKKYVPTVLKEIIILDSCTSIENYAFYNCSSLTNIVISNSVIRIGNSAFKNCTSLISIVLPSSVISIGNFAFDGCTSLTIYCEVESQPSDWNSEWNLSDCPVVWGYKG